MKPLIRRFDRYAGERVGSLPKSWYKAFDWLCIIASPIGWAVVILVGLTLAIYVNNEALVKFSVATLILLPLAEVIKLVFRRPRPLSLYAESMRLKSYSFPSGHSYGAALSSGYTFLYISMFISGIWLWMAGLILAVLSIAIAIARVYLKAHFPSDVTVGLALGIVTVFLAGWWIL